MTEHFISDTVVWRIQPGLLAGTRTLYGGVRFLLAPGYGNKYGHLRPRWSYGPGLLAGASFGDRLRLMPEAEAFWTVSSGFAFVLGVNVELHARTREASGLGW